MSKKKTATTKPTKKPAKTTKTATASPVVTHGDDASLVAAAKSRLAAWPPISDVERAAFASRAPDDVCDALGVRTKSDGVAREAIAWAKTIDLALRAAPSLLRPYSPARFVWLLENVVSLLDARASARAELAKTTLARGDGASALATARDVRGDLLGILDALAGDAPDDRKALDLARGVVDGRAALATSLSALADLADAWLARTDPTSKALVAAAGLVRGDVDRARTAASSLVDATSASALGVRIDARDTVAVNRVEGRVLFEMRAAMHAFDAAHARDKSVPKLVPGAATRGTLGSSKGASKTATTTPAAPPSA